MKKIFYLIMCLLTLTFVACDKPAPEEDVDFFTISVSDVTATSALVAVTPLDTTVTYYFDIMTKEDFAHLQAVDSVVLSEIEYFDAVIDYYSAYGLTYADFLSAGHDEYEFTKLTSSEDYVAFAFTLDATTLTSGKLQFVEFSTLETETSSMTIEFVATDTALFIVPSNDEELWYISICAQDTLDTYGYASMEDYANAEFNYYATYYTDYVDDYLCYVGTVYAPYDIFSPGVNEVAVCVVKDATRVSDWFFYTYTPSATSAPKKAMKHADKRFVTSIANRQNTNFVIK